MPPLRGTEWFRAWNSNSATNSVTLGRLPSLYLSFLVCEMKIPIALITSGCYGEWIQPCVQSAPDYSYCMVNAIEVCYYYYYCYCYYISITPFCLHVAAYFWCLSHLRSVTYLDPRAFEDWCFLRFLNGVGVCVLPAEHTELINFFLLACSSSRHHLRCNDTKFHTTATTSLDANLNSFHKTKPETCMN